MGTNETGGTAEDGGVAEAADTMDAGSEGADGADDEGNSGDGDGDGNSGDGDGNSGDGDGDGNSGDGDGDGNSGDGDGDGNSGDGDGDGNSGDGDGDGNSGDGDGDGNSGDGDGDNNPGDGDGDNNPGDGDGDGVGVLMCGNKLFACGDTLDNDMDGLVDLDDPECTTPCDNDEGSFQTNLPGQNQDCKSDCYFDGNSGGGDDQCDWNLQCDPMNPGAEIGCAYNSDLGDQMCQAQVSDTCLAVCVPLVPNGCDCFGCCEIDGQFIYLDGSPDCALDNLDACQSCTFNYSCPNECEPENCEVCFGQDPDDLPPECQEPECPDGIEPCFDESDCQAGEFCQTGCCAPII